MPHKDQPLSVKMAAPFCILLLVVLLSQVVGVYVSNSFLASGGFKGYWILSRLVLPFIVVFLLAIPLKHLYFSRPTINRETLIFMGVLFGLLLCLFIYLQFFAADYLSHYRHGRSLEGLRESGAFQRFLIFTASTIIGWEIIHRGFLLGGGQYCLTKHYKVNPAAAAVIMTIIVCIFEVLFHIKKPIYEAVGMIFASPLLSCLTLKTRSLWPALTFHLLIELAFGFSAFYYSVS
ncbi:CPBP family glutamic-type intramembrane protease [Shewanella algicola]|uniref:CPBP family glutamic-type intramembrane protease n=1 Tax=Shewanella algicola TaxID=640633 RepID=UPI002493DB46|nr:CPBP family glutamic-type intramembrane protease [Shewanella algicola]